MNISDKVTADFLALHDESQARHLMRFFKCGKGEYGEGDRFLGIRVPRTRELVKTHRKEVSLDDCLRLVESEWHEVRLAGFLLMIEIYSRCRRKKDERGKRNVVDRYLESIQYGNNWDLVDLVAPKILGEWLVEHPDQRGILDYLAGRRDSLWHQRVAIVATWTLICKGRFDDTMRIADSLLDHPHDLIHKATGWMLREVGKRGGMDLLLEYLDKNAVVMPRTMLRYAIERFPDPLRRHYLNLRSTPEI